MSTSTIPVIDFAALDAREPATMAVLREAACEIGFFTLVNTPLSPKYVGQVIDTYRSFFCLPAEIKQTINMAETGSNRGWGAPHSEQVDPDANPDYKQVFDCGFELAPDDPLRAENLSVYADNLWPADQEEFRLAIQNYYDTALKIAHRVLSGIASASGQDATYFDNKFTRPMALLRGNFYPPRPADAGEKDFGIAAHTDYGCITLLATDGVAGLEVELADGTWIPVETQPGSFVINFGEMLEMWTEGKVKATKHRVIGGPDERISVPMFFNPNHDANVAPQSSDKVIKAGEYLARRFNETYVHLMEDA